MRIPFTNRNLSLLEGPVDNVRSRAKAWDTKSGVDLTQDPVRTFDSMRKLRNTYLAGGYVAEAADLFPIFAIGEGYDLVIDEKIADKYRTDGEEEKQLVKEFFERVNFFDIQWQLSIDAETVRDGVGEIVCGEGELSQTPVNIIPRPGECFEFKTDISGRITTYDQVYDNRGHSITPISFEPKAILHYQFLSRPDSPYGISILERTLHDIKRDTQVAEAVTSGVCLHGTPKFCTVVNGTRQDAAKISDDDWKEFEDSQKDFNAKDNFLYEGDVKMEVIDTAGVPNVQQYSDVTLFRVCAGMGTPAELLGLRQGTTDATAVSRIGAFLKKVRIVQRDIESLWNLNVIDKITGMPGLVKLKLKDANPEDFVQISTAIAALRQGQNPEAVAPKEWARKRLNIPTNQELGIPDDLAISYPPEREANKGPVAAAEAELAASAHELSQAIREMQEG